MKGDPRLLGAQAEHEAALRRRFVQTLQVLIGPGRPFVSQNALAKHLGIGHALINRWAKGESLPTVPHLTWMAHRLAMPIEKLLAGWRL